MLIAAHFAFKVAALLYLLSFAACLACKKKIVANMAFIDPRRIGQRGGGRHAIPSGMAYAAHVFGARSHASFSGNGRGIR